MSGIQQGLLASFFSKELFSLFTWGRGNYGALGLNDTVNRSSPVQVGALTNWAQVDAGNGHTACVTTEGTLFTWGANTSYGQLGLNDTVNRSSPVQVGALTNWAQVSAGHRFTACVTKAGTLFTWGRGNNGQLGHNNTASLSSPVQVGALTNWAQVSVGGYFTACVTTAGTLFTWGGNINGQLGQNNIGFYSSRSSPVQVGALTNWAQVSAGKRQAVGRAACVTTAGTLFVWGTGPLGSNGTGETNSYLSSPVQVGALTNWAQVSVGQYDTACVTTAGTLFTWGSSSYGQLGHNNTVNRSSPVQVGALTNWAQVSGGNSLTACVTTGGTLFIWGRNAFGSIGAGNTVSRSSPVQVGALTNWVQVSAGAFQTACTQTA